MINYSIIIPFRDKFDLVRKAVGSIPDREDIQIILIYNGRDELQESFLPVRNKSELLLLKSSPTKGAGHARNVGLEKVVGKFLLFLDADDYFTDVAFDAFDKYIDSDAEIIYFKPTSKHLSTDSPSKRHVDYANKLERFLISGNEDELRYRWEVPWSKMIRTELARRNNFKFDELIVNNDAWFSLLTGHAAKKITADEAVVYVVTEGEVGQSLVKTVTPELIFIRFKVAVRTNIFLKSINKKHMRIRLLGYIYLSLKKWGPIQAYRLIKYAYKHNTSIF